MKIGFAGPVSLQMLAAHINNGKELPVGYEFPPMALWVEELLRRGHEVTLFSLAPGLATPRYFVGPRLRIYVGCYRSRHRARDLFRQEREDLRAAMSASDCDVIHAHWTYEFALAALAAGKPTLVTAHDAPGAILRLNRDGYRALRFAMAWMVARRARTLTAVSTYVAEHFRRVLHYRGDMTVVPNGLPTAWFSADHVRRGRSHVFTYATVLSGWGPVKNGELALLAYQRVRQELPATRLLMFGGGYELGGPAHRWALAHGVAGSVEFAGPVRHQALAARLAAEADVLIHPAKEESFCMAAAEAMALGIPVIAGHDAGGITDVVEDGVAGLLVPLRPCEMAYAMRRLATDEGLCKSLSGGARARAEREYSIANVFDAYEVQYRRIRSRHYPVAQHD